MLRNYFIIAVRNILKHKAYSFINITGLTIGIASCILIFQYVVFENSFDNFHENSSELYRVGISMFRPGDEPGVQPETGYALAPALDDAVPEIIFVTRLHPEYDAAIVSTPNNPERVFEETDIYYADPAFLKMFTFQFESAVEKTALQSGTVIITKKAALKYFNKTNPLGEFLNITGHINKTYKIAGVLKEVPANSHLKFDILLPMDDLLRGETYSNESEVGWIWNNFITYIQTRPDADPKIVERKMTQTFKSYRAEQLRQQGYTVNLLAQPVRDIHLNSKIEAPKAVMGSYETVYFFSVVGIITLLIALVNYLNLAAARSLNRAREVGMRKVIGAHRKQLILQFLCESALINFIAAVLSLALVETAIPLVNNLAETSLTGILWGNPLFWLVFFITFIICALFAGLYPGFILSSFKPIAALKGKIGPFITQLWLRRILVILQFAASVALIGGTIIVYKQLDYMRNINPGLNLEQVLTVAAPRVLPQGIKHEYSVAAFLQELKQIPDIRQTATSWSVPGQGFNWNGASLRKSIDDPSISIRGVATYIDSGFANLYRLELAAGKGFNNITVPDTGNNKPWSVILNETAVKSLGFKSSEEAVGQSIVIGDYNANITGVFRDFNWSSAHVSRQNMVFGYTEAGNLISLKINTYNLSGTIKSIQKIYSKLFPGNVFKYAFVNETFDQQYKNDMRFATLFTIFAGLAIFIACLGLFGLASFTTKQRTKEIGVRKVIGATTIEILILLSKDFLSLVIAAVIIAAPVTYLLMTKWLENFAYRISISAVIFILTGTLVIFIAILSVSFHSIRTALANPIDSLRYE